MKTLQEADRYDFDTEAGTPVDENSGRLPDKRDFPKFSSQFDE